MITSGGSMPSCSAGQVEHSFRVRLMLDQLACASGSIPQRRSRPNTLQNTNHQLRVGTGGYSGI